MLASSVIHGNRSASMPPPMEVMPPSPASNHVVRERSGPASLGGCVTRRPDSPVSSIGSPETGSVSLPTGNVQPPQHIHQPRPISPRYFRPPPGGGPMAPPPGIPGPPHHLRGPPPTWSGPRGFRPPPFDLRYSPRGMPRRPPMGPRQPPRHRLPGRPIFCQTFFLLNFCLNWLQFQTRKIERLGYFEQNYTP